MLGVILKTDELHYLLEADTAATSAPARQVDALTRFARCMQSITKALHSRCCSASLMQMPLEPSQPWQRVIFAVIAFDLEHVLRTP
jgi:hypothetical protein